MKKYISVIISAAFAVSLFSAEVFAERTVTAGDYVFEQDDGELELIGYSGSDSDVNIPDSINGVRVTKIDDRAFYGSKSITSATIPEGVREIGEYAFSDCTALTFISMPDTLEEIDDYAFSGCTALASVSLGENVREIGEYAFSHCGALENIYIPSSVRDIGDGAFSHNSALKEITFPEGLRELGENDGLDGVCFGCENLAEVNLPSTLTEINPRSFKECGSLSQVSYGGSKEQWDKLLQQNRINSVDFDQKLSFGTAVQGNDPSEAGTQTFEAANTQPLETAEVKTLSPEAGNITDANQGSVEETAAPPAESLSMEEIYRQQNDATLKNILIIQGIAIGALLLILIIVVLVSFVKKQSRKKIIAEKQAEYDREKEKLP